MNISIFYEKQNSYKTIKDLTYHIGNVGVELKESNQNREDIDIAAYTYNDVKYIRKEIQVNNEDIYFFYDKITYTAETGAQTKLKPSLFGGFSITKFFQNFLLFIGQFCWNHNPNFYTN